MQAKTFEQLKTEASWYTLNTVIYFIIHSNRFSPSSGHLFILFAIQHTVTQRVLFILCATEMKSWGSKKEKNPCPKFPFKSEVWKDIKQSTQCYCCRKVNSASTESKAISRGPITSSPTVNNKIQGERVLLGEMEFLIALPLDYHWHLWAQLFPFSE